MPASTSGYDHTDYVRTLPAGPLMDGPTFDRMTVEYLWAKTRERQHELDRERLTTPLPDWLARARAVLERALGDLPVERAPLKARTLATVRREGYRYEKVVFQSRPGWYVTGLLYLPDPLPEPVPGILGAHGHFERGRFEHATQAACITLARAGYAVFQVDMTGYGDRRFVPHSREALYLWLVGMSPTGVELHDH